MTTHRTTLTIAIVILALVTFASLAVRADAHTWGPHKHIKRGTVAYCNSHAIGTTRRACTIRVIFGRRHGADAVRVARCESRIDPRARNGQYRGVFQMGSSERKRYGHGPTVKEQAWAARRYFVASGSDWSPWECKPR